jgi:tricorn protease
MMPNFQKKNIPQLTKLMKRNHLLLFLCLLAISPLVQAQINARLLQQPDVSETHITFVYAGDVWTVPKTGGTATRLSSPAGVESFPKFSPDGKQIAYSANYHGNVDVYVVPTIGGLPARLTQHSFGDRVIDWHPDGESILFASSRESGRQRFSQFYLINKKGGMADKLPVPYGEFGAFSPDGKQFAYTDKSRVFRTWKRYRGGTAPDVVLFDLDDLGSETIIDSDANDEIPMWIGNKIYFLSDRGENERANIWSFDTSGKALKQLTDFADYDVHFPSGGPSDIVFEAGGKLYLLNLSSEQTTEVPVEVITDQITLQPTLKDASKNLSNAWISPDGKRVVVEARGELFSVPAENGYVQNLTQTSGIAERYPAWSPDGKYIAHWSDKSGEYELMLKDVATGSEEKVTNYGPGYRYQLYWSPDSKKLGFVDKAMKIKIYEIDNQRTTDVDQGLSMYEGALRGFSVNWSADSKWMAYSRDLPNNNLAVFLYDTKNYTKHQVSNGYYSCMQPAFDPEGKYLYVLTNRNFNPVYGDFDNSWTYPNATQLAAISLRKDVASPLAPKNDSVEIEEEKDDTKEEGKDKKKDKKKDKDENGDEKVDEVKPVEIDLDGFENRMVILPEPAGNYTNVQAVAGKVVYQKFPNTGSEENDGSIKYFDLEERESKTILSGANDYMISADGKKMLVRKGGTFAVIDVAADQKMEEVLNTADMKMTVDPMAEWKQIFRDAWRLERDFFYDEDMHGVNWDEMYRRYGAMIEEAATRDDVNFILGELIGELNASHTYKGGGDRENGENLDVGYLGVDYELSDGKYRIKKILKGASWDIEAKSPLDMPAVEAKEGDYLLAVNGIPVDATKEPYFGFQGLGGKTVQLTLNSQPILEGSRKVIVETMKNEVRLRHLAWIEANRKMVEDATDGKVGYIYVRSTGFDGQNELVRQFMAQWDKEGLIVDERFNSGGQIPDRFIELLNRKPLAYWAVRDGQDWQWPPVAHFGPKVMLINGWSGSGGDAFPDYFRKAGLGPLIGTRTWGGLIGISGAPQLIDGGTVTVPTFRMYDPDGKWFLEGHGVDPDIEVKENPTTLASGGDAQLQKAIEVILDEMQKNGYTKPDHPPVEER